MSVTAWMAWENGVDVMGRTDPSLEAPNVLIHVASMVHTPVGSCPAGMLVWQPDPDTDPVVAFLTENKKVGKYFGPHIFAGTPFEEAPLLPVLIDFKKKKSGAIRADIETVKLEFRVTLDELGSVELISRAPNEKTPFHQQGLEVAAGSCSVRFNGDKMALTVADANIAGGPGALWSPFGAYAR